MLRFLTLAVVCASVSGVPNPALSQSTAEVPGTPVVDPIAQAIAAYDSQDFLEARRWFGVAHSQSPSARTLRGLGIASFALGDYESAVSQLEAALVHPVRPLTDDLRATVLELLVQARERVGRIEVGDRDANPPASEENSPLSVDPIPADAPGPTPARTASSDDPTGVAPDAVASPTTSPAPRGARWRRARLFAMLAPAVAFVGGGAGLYGVAFGRFRDLRDRCTREGCTNAKVDRGYDEANIDSLRRTGFTALGVGLALAAAGTTCSLVHRASDRPTASLLVGPARARLVIAF